jgi:phage recombination protein Bet
MNALARWTPQQVSLIKKTVAKDCDRNSRGEDLHLGEFDWAMEICNNLGLNPLQKQIFFFVYNKDDPAKRSMVPVIGIGGYRAIAARAGDYRPGQSEIVIDERLIDPDTNPLGIAYAETTVYKYIHGEWHAFSDKAWWSEFAPLKEIWGDDRKPTGKFRLDPKKDGWRKMARLMITKCSEALALRRGWPENLAGTYVEEEIDRQHTIDLTATEMANQADQGARLERIGGPAITVQWGDRDPLERVPVGKFGDRAMEFIRKHMVENAEDPGKVTSWAARNREAIREFWAIDKDAALSIRAELDKVEAFAKRAPKQGVR